MKILFKFTFNSIYLTLILCYENIFRILKVNKPEELFKIMFEKIDYFVKNETLKLKQSS